MAAEASRSAASAADSYIGSLISLISKSEIRYEGILFNINTEESTIGLRNVQSFGTEGRKKDGPQIPASDKIYDYILFRGTDIKDLQVKFFSLPFQTVPIYNDPAIIQSHSARPPSASTSLPSVGSGNIVYPGSHTAQLGLPRPNFHGGLPLQHGGSLRSWGSSPAQPARNDSGLAVPLYWQQYYTPSGGLPHLQQPTSLQAQPVFPISHSMQQPVNTSLLSGSPHMPEFPHTLLRPVSNTLSLNSITLPLISAPSQASSLVPDTSQSLAYNAPLTSLSAATLGANLPFVPPLSTSFESMSALPKNMPSIVSSKPVEVPATIMAYQTTIVESSSPSQVETSLPLGTPSRLLQPSLSTLPSSQPLRESLEEVDVEPNEVKSKQALPKPPVLAPSQNKEPILPLPTPTDQKYPRPVTRRFTEEFDFIAMNERFKKDEVWGHLGRSKARLRGREGESGEDDCSVEEVGANSLHPQAKPVYVKDDFFDSIDLEARRNGRTTTSFSERLKLDVETFGDFQRYGRARGSYYGGRYGYDGRGRGRPAAADRRF